MRGWNGHPFHPEGPYAVNWNGRPLPAQRGIPGLGAFYAPQGAYYAPTGHAPQGAFYAPQGAYYAPTGAFYEPTGAFYEPTGAFYEPTGGYYDTGDWPPIMSPGAPETGFMDALAPLNGIVETVKANPLLAIGAAAAIYFLVIKKKKGGSKSLVGKSFRLKSIA
jgi:hypothetical protein